jgi:hypothetical protein
MVRRMLRAAIACWLPIGIPARVGSGTPSAGSGPVHERNDEYVPMADDYSAWEGDAALLRVLGRQLGAQAPRVRVRLRRDLANQARAAWQRNDPAGGLPGETVEQRIVRDQAASLALIGLAIDESGVESGDHVVFDVDASVLGAAVRAAAMEDRRDEVNRPR